MIKGLGIESQDMSEAKLYGVSSPPHSNMGGGNQNRPVPSHICLEGWDEWIDSTFMASFRLWTHKDQISYKCLHYCIYEFFGLQCHMVLELCKKNPL
jgi:hypothetical protein